MKNDKKSIYPKVDKLRCALADETAKIIMLEGIKDFRRAKLKASERLGNSNFGSLPSNIEIEEAINSFQNTFLPDHKEIVFSQRQVALEIMQFLQDYSPFLVGSVLEGTSGVNSPISIHVSSDTVENVINQIKAKSLRIDIAERRLKLNNQLIFVPTICFEYQNFEIEVLIFSLRQQHQLPKSKSRNRSMQRMNIKGLQEMLQTNGMQG